MNEIPGPLGRSRRRRAKHLFLPLLVVTRSVLPRLVDILLALFLLLLLSPFLLPRGAAAWFCHARLFDKQERSGRFRRNFQRLSFAGPWLGRESAVLLNILRGDMAFAGPRALTPREAARTPLDSLARFSVRPGLFSPYSLRRKTGIAHDGEYRSDLEFVYTEKARDRLGLPLRAGVAALLGGGEARPAPALLNFFGVSVVNTTMDEAVTWIIQRAKNQQKALLAFVNPDCLNIAYRHAAYKNILREAERVLPDGIGIHIGCRMTGHALIANVNGTDLFPFLCEHCAAQGLSLFLLGARPGVAEQVARHMQARFPTLRIAGQEHGYFSADEEAAVIERINASGAQILLAAFGVPRQEIWLHTHRDALRPAVCMGVGGLFDFYSGRIPRAPMWMREVGLEWVWRLLQEPGRMWRRYIIGNPLFLYRVWRQQLEQKTIR